MFPPHQNQTFLSELDVTLAFKLMDKCRLINYSYQHRFFPPPTNLKYDPGNLPSLQNANYVDAMHLIKDMRNAIFHRVAPITEPEFKRLWTFLMQLLKLLGYDITQLSGLENGSLDGSVVMDIAKFKGDLISHATESEYSGTNITNTSKHDQDRCG